MVETYPPQGSNVARSGVDWGAVFLVVSVILLVIIAGLIIYARYVQAPAADQTSESDMNGETPAPVVLSVPPELHPGVPTNFPPPAPRPSTDDLFGDISRFLHGE